MNPLKYWLITIICIAIVIAGLGYVKFSQIKAAIAFGESFPEASETVEASRAKWSSYQPSVTVMGEIKSKYTVDIRNEVEGIITSVNMPSGARVKKGDILAQLNVDSEMALLDAVKAEIDLAQLEVKRFANLVNLNASSKELLDRATAQLAINQARARKVEADIAKKTLIAPFSGFTSIHDWQIGTYLPANTLLVNITGENDAVWVDFNLPQIYANIDIGTAVKVKSNALETQSIPANLLALNQQLNTRSRTLHARAEIRTPPKSLRPGIVVIVELPTGSEVPAIPLPNQAIRYDTFGSFVYVLVKDEQGDLRAKRKPVSVISKEAELTFVTKGIDEDDLIATIGSAKLFPNLLTYVRE